MKHNKNTLIKEVSESTGYSTKDVKIIIDCFIDRIMEKVLNFEKVSIKGFLSIFTYEARSKNVSNFSTGERYVTGDRYLPKCEFSKTFVSKVKSK